jgi:hypothetical protein
MTTFFSDQVRLNALRALTEILNGTQHQRLAVLELDPIQAFIDCFSHYDKYHEYPYLCLIELASKYLGVRSCCKLVFRRKFQRRFHNDTHGHFCQSVGVAQGRLFHENSILSGVVDFVPSFNAVLCCGLCCTRCRVHGIQSSYEYSIEIHQL